MLSQTAAGESDLPLTEDAHSSRLIMLLSTRQGKDSKDACESMSGVLFSTDSISERKTFEHCRSVGLSFRSFGEMFTQRRILRLAVYGRINEVCGTAIGSWFCDKRFGTNFVQQWLKSV